MTGMELTGLEWTVLICSAVYTTANIFNWKHKNKLYMVWLVVFTFLLISYCTPR